MKCTPILHLNTFVGKEKIVLTHFEENTPFYVIKFSLKHKIKVFSNI